MKKTFPLSAFTLALLTLNTHAETQQLEAITVVGSTSTSHGYTATGTYSATGLPLTLRELPQSISVLTAKQLQDQNIRTLDRALQQTTGVSQQIYGSNRAGYNYIFARGQKVSHFQLDGALMNEQLADTGNLGTGIYERIEVVRGISGLLDGSGEPSATVNLVRKQPQKTPLAEITLGAGSRGRYLSQLDLSHSLNSSGTLRGRTILSTEGGKSWRQRERDRAYSIYAVLDYDLSPKTLFRIGAHWQYAKERANAAHSFATYDNEGYATPLGAKDNPATNYSYSRSRSLNLFASLEHNFQNDWQAKLQYAYTRSDWDSPHGVAGILSINHQTGATDLISGYWLDKPESHSYNASLNGQYSLFGRMHDVTFGVNHFRYQHNRHGKRAIGQIANVYEFSHRGNAERPQVYPIDIQGAGYKRQVGGYVATRLHATDSLSIIAGGRYSQVNDGSYNKQKGGIESLKDHRFVPYAGVVFDMTPSLSLYGSYSGLFIPQSQKDQNGSYLSPVKGTNLEAGIKGAWFDNTLNLSASVFEAHKKGIALLAGKHADGEQYYRAADRTKTRGWEMELAGNLTPHWQLQAGFSQTLTQDSHGKRLNTESVPRHTLKLFTSYDLARGATSGWTIGAGLRWQSETYLDNITFRPPVSAEIQQRALANARQKAYAVVDVMARYRFNRQADLSLNVDNLFNRHYRTQPDRHSYGALRNLNATFRYRF